MYIIIIKKYFIAKNANHHLSLQRIVIVLQAECLVWMLMAAD